MLRQNLKLINLLEPFRQLKNNSLKPLDYEDKLA